MVKIRPYYQNDKIAVIELLRSNTPAFFDPAEEKDLIEYLHKELEDYFVVEENNEIIGAGGVNYFLQEKIARISWDIIKPNAQGKGIGKKLTEYRINYLNKNSEVDLIVVRTSQLVYKFYEKRGFQLKKIEKDFWAKNFDLYYLELKNKKEL
jgi:ribosomal protein S18 acetylase RimI-like enzyme